MDYQTVSTDDKYNKLLLMLEQQTINPDLDKIKNITEYYKEKINKINIKHIKKKELLITSDYIKNFYIEFFPKYKDKFETINLNEVYTTEESMVAVYKISNTLFKNVNNDNITIKIIKKTLVLLFEEYMLSSKEYIMQIKNNEKTRIRIINERVNIILNKLKLIDIYQENKDINEYIYENHIKYNDLIETDFETDYTYIYSNILSEFLLEEIKKDKNNICKIMYLIDLLNNNNNFNDLNVLCSLLSLNLTVDSIQLSSLEEIKTKNLSFSSKIPITIITTFIVTFVIPNNYTDAKINYHCSNTYYTKDTARYCINEIFDDNVLLSDTNKNTLDILKSKVSLISDNDEFLIKIEDGYRQQNEIVRVTNIINNLFIDDNLTLVKEDITLKERYYAYNELIKLPQQDIINEKLKYIELVDEYLNSKESVELIEVPFISQKDAKIYNGCEAASLLMALQYKNKLLDYDLAKFVLEMPKHDSDPHQGFIYDIYNYYPTNVAHWIAPDALSKFASNYKTAIDISGSNIEKLKQAIDNNNPVIVYVTANFSIPIISTEEVPTNLHVVLLVGYNKINNNYIVMDPYYGRMEIEKDKFENSYNYLKYAVVIN